MLSLTDQQTDNQFNS